LQAVPWIPLAGNPAGLLLRQSTREWSTKWSAECANSPEKNNFVDPLAPEVQKKSEEIRVRNKTPETPARSESFAGQGHCKTLGHRRGYNRTLFTVAFGRGIGSAAIAKLQNTSHE